jgi:dihydrofolate reductase
MRKLVVFNLVSLDGYFVDRNGEMSWAHAHDPEFKAFVEGNAKGGGELLFGRVTYDLMASYWPTAAAAQNDPVVAEHMNTLPKVVFSRTMNKANWNNTKVVQSDIGTAVKKMKQEPGPDMVIMGSGNIVSQLAQNLLIDEYQVVVIPLVLGKGRTMFEGLGEKQHLKLKTSRTFSNGNVFLVYEVLKK